jgi:aminoglycoside 3-N-acetyltransferase I
MLTSGDVPLLEALLTVFAEAFGDIETYTGTRPGTGYLAQLLGQDHFVALAAVKDTDVVGGLVAYVLEKFEQERSEIYIYDLAVASAHRREGIATALIDELRNIAAARRSHVIFVQADRRDDAAIALYSKLGIPEDVLHFDIATS